MRRCKASSKQTATGHAVLQSGAYEVTPHVLPIISDIPAAPIERVDVFSDGRAFVLRNVLSPAECDGYMAAAESMGMCSVRASGYEKRVRDCQRVAAKSDELATKLFDRIAPFLAPVDLSKRDMGGRPKGVTAAAGCGMWRPHGLNEVFRICKYNSGGHFAPHLDGGHARSTTDRSLLTFMLYLNDGFTGGCTRFFDDDQQAYAPPEPTSVIHTYVPHRGDALVFYSELMHDGEALTSGEKWILRSEVMFGLAQSRASALLADLWAKLGDGGAIVGVDATVAAVAQGRVSAVLVRTGLRATRDGDPLIIWLAARLGGEGELVVLPAEETAAGIGRQFVEGMEGVGAILRADGDAKDG